MAKRIVLLVCLLASLVGPGPVLAQAFCPVPRVCALKPEQQVNNRFVVADGPVPFPSLQRFADGSTWIVWQGAGSDGDGDGIEERLFDYAARPEYDETQLNRVSEGDQLLPKLLRLPSGAWFAAWESYEPPTQQLRIRFTTEGFLDEQLTPSCRASSSTLLDRLNLTTNSSGQIVMAYTGCTATPALARVDVFGGRFSDEVTLSQSTGYVTATGVSVSLLDSGRFAAVWSGNGVVRARVFEITSQTAMRAISNEIILAGAAGTWGDVAAIEPDRFVAVYKVGRTLRTQLIDEDGTLRGGETIVRQDADVVWPVVAVKPAGGPTPGTQPGGTFLVLWNEGAGFHGRLFSRDGSPWNVDIPLTTDRSDRAGRAAWDANGNFSVAWIAAGVGGGQPTALRFREWNVTFPSSTATLTVTRSGKGHGTVTSSPTGIDCGTDCSDAYPVNTVVTLTERADGGSRFLGWNGDCRGNQPSVTLTLKKATKCNAQFGRRR